MDYFWNAVWSLTPTVLVGLLFWLILWAILRADRHERAAQVRIEEEELARIRAEEPAAG